MAADSSSDTFRLSSVQSSLTLTPPRTEGVDPLSALRVTCRKYEEENCHLRQEVECSTECIRRLNGARSVLSGELETSQRQVETLERERDALAALLATSLKALGGEPAVFSSSLLGLAQEVARVAASRSKLKLKKKPKGDENEPPTRPKSLAKVKRCVNSGEFEVQMSRGRLTLTHKSSDLTTAFETAQGKEKMPSRKQSLQVRLVGERPETHKRTLSFTENDYEQPKLFARISRLFC